MKLNSKEGHRPAREDGEPGGSAICAPQLITAQHIYAVGRVPLYRWSDTAANATTLKLTAPKKPLGSPINRGNIAKLTLPDTNKRDYGKALRIDV